MSQPQYNTVTNQTISHNIFTVTLTTERQTEKSNGSENIISRLQRLWLLTILYTSDVTGRQRGLKRKHTFVCWCVAPPGDCYSTMLCCNDYFSSSSVVSCAFSALCMYSKFRHHPHPLGYLCTKFFFHCLPCWASPWRKIVYSIDHPITQSPSLLFDAPGTEA